MRPPHAILLVEDNDAEVKIAQRALRESGFAGGLLIVHDGQEALDYLFRQGAHADDDGWRCPDLILLDLNLPRVNGREVLERLRASPALKAVPVVVLSTSARQEEVEEAYAAGANTYIQKPQDFARFVEVLRAVRGYWLDIALLPGRRA
jgi:two-component system response regulator